MEARQAITPRKMSSPTLLVISRPTGCSIAPQFGQMAAESAICVLQLRQGFIGSPYCLHQAAQPDGEKHKSGGAGPLRQGQAGEGRRGVPEELDAEAGRAVEHSLC